MFDSSSEQGEVLDSDSQNQNKSHVFKLNNIENLELENLSENQKLSNPQILYQQNNNQIKEFILNINLILTLSYIVQITLGIVVCVVLAFVLCLSCQHETGKIVTLAKLFMFSFIIIILLVFISIKLLKLLWKYQIQLVIFVSIFLIFFNASIWFLLVEYFKIFSNQLTQYNKNENVKLQYLQEIKRSLALWYFYFNFQLGIILLQTHITYKMSTNKQINLIFTNFIVSILCGCSVIFLPSYTIILLIYQSLLSYSDMIYNIPWRWEGFLINPIVFSIYTFLYIRSIKQIQNGKFQLRDDQKYIGALLTFINMFI